MGSSGLAGAARYAGEGRELESPCGSALYDPEFGLAMLILEDMGEEAGTKMIRGSTLYVSAQILTRPTVIENRHQTYALTGRRRFTLHVGFRHTRIGYTSLSASEKTQAGNISTSKIIRLMMILEYLILSNYHMP